MEAAKSSGNLYLAHSLMKFIGQTGANCAFRQHPQFAATQWQFCSLQDLDQGADLLRNGMDEEQVDQRLWNDALKEQNVGTRFYQTIYCCNACALHVLTGHVNEKHLARSMMAMAQAKNKALLLVSELSNKLPLIIAVPLTIRAEDIRPLLQVEIKTR